MPRKFFSLRLRIWLQFRQLTRCILCVAGLSYWTTTDPGPAGQMVHSPHRRAGRPQKQRMYQPSYQHIGQGAFQISIGMDITVVHFNYLCTYDLYSPPCLMFWMRGSITRASGMRLGHVNREFFRPWEMAASR